MSRINRVKSYSFFYLIFLIIGIVLYYIGGINLSYNFYLLIFIGLTLYSILWIRFNLSEYHFLYKSISMPSYLLFLSAIIVYFQNPLNFFLEFANVADLMGDNSYNNYLNRVFGLSVISLSSFLYGHFLTHGREFGNKEKKKHNKKYRVSIWVLLTVMAFVMFVINIDPIAFLTGQVYSEGVASEIEREGMVGERWETLFDILNTITIAVIANNKKLDDENISFWRYYRSFPVLLIAINVLYLVLRGLSGDRGPVIYTALVLFYSYIYCSKKYIKNGILFAFMLIGIFIIAMANVYRGQDSTLSISEKIKKANDDEQMIDRRSISPFTQELANSINCNFIAVRDIDIGKTDYKYGEYAFNEINGIIPGTSLVYKFLTDKPWTSITTGDYVSTSYFGKNYRISLGSTAVTDFYMDYGLIGVVLGFLLLGYTYKKIDYAFVSNLSVPALVFVLKVSSMAVYLPRSTYLFVIGKALYGIIIYCLVCMLIPKYLLIKK